MNAEFNLDQYLSDGVEAIVSDALKAAFKNPKETAFLLQYTLHAKRAAAKRETHAKAGRHVPSFLIASITSRCNLHCAGCYARANNICHDGTDEGLLTDAEWENIFVQAAEIGVSFVLLAGGEPMLRRGVIECASDHPDLLFPIFTNGTLLGEQTLELLDRRRNLVPIISVEGDEAQTDARRGAGTYQKLLETMTALQSRGVFFGASVTVTSENLPFVTSDAFLSDLRERGCKIAFYVEYVPADPGTESLAPGDAERVYLTSRLDELRARSDAMVYVAFPGDEQYAGGCMAAGRGFFHINPHGGAEPCPFSPVSDTSLKDVSLLEALDSPLFVRLRSSELLAEHHDGACALFGREDEVRSLCERS
ncbi:MAG: radical SAM protein [Clostridiaceae bacterium]